jgi:hypothetical protein
MKDSDCPHVRLVTGTLEGVAFQPDKSSKRRFSRGIYGLVAEVCLDCGNILQITVDVQTLKDVIVHKQ